LAIWTTNLREYFNNTFHTLILPPGSCLSPLPCFSVIRKEAALTCTKLLLPSGKPPPPHSYLSRVVGQVLEKLLISGIADPNPAIRRAVLAALDEPFDYHLSQAENLRSLFCAMNDEIFEVSLLSLLIVFAFVLLTLSYLDKRVGLYDYGKTSYKESCLCTSCIEKDLDATFD
jgi:hypothetical protein